MLSLTLASAYEEKCTKICFVLIHTYIYEFIFIHSIDQASAILKPNNEVCYYF